MEKVYRHIYQEVCPFNNERFVQIAEERDYRSDWRAAADRPGVPGELPTTTSPSLVALMGMTGEERDRWTRGSAIRRAGYAGFRRNVAVAMGTGWRRWTSRRRRRWQCCETRWRTGGSWCGSARRGRWSSGTAPAHLLDLLPDSYDGPGVEERE